MSFVESGATDSGSEGTVTGDGSPDPGVTEAPPTEAAPGSDVGSTPQGETLDVDAYGNHLVPIQVDGQDKHVPLSELRSGYQRQSDYTRKTQEVASERKRLQQFEALGAALDRDPEGTVRALADAYRIPMSQQGQADQAGSSEWDDLDPQERQIAELKQKVESMESSSAKSQVQQKIESEFQSLEQSYGKDAVNRQDVATYALRNHTTITDAYKALEFDRFQQERRSRETEEQKALAAKREAQDVHQGGGTQRGSVSDTSEGKLLSVGEAWQAAMKQLQGA